MQKILLYIIFFLGVESSLSSNLEVDRIYSSNGKYYADIIEYSSPLKDDLGQTKIYKNNGKHILTIDRYFVSRETYLSNDGKCLISLDELDDSVHFYKNGKNYKNISVHEYLNCDIDSQSCLLTYSNHNLRKKGKMDFNNPDYLGFNRYYGKRDTIIGNKSFYEYKPDADSVLIFADKYSTFSYNDSLYIITPDLNLFIFSICNGQSKKYNYRDRYNDIKNIASPNKFKVLNYTYEYLSFPVLENGSLVIDTLSNHFNFYFTKDFPEDYDSLLYYNISIDVLLDTNGNIRIVDYFTNKELITDKTLKFVKSLKYKKLDMPGFVEEWCFSNTYLYRNKDKIIAASEKREYDSLREIEYLRNLKKDTLEGSYIPKNINDAIIELDKNLSIKYKNIIDSLSSEEDLSLFHFGKGMELRNNWLHLNGSRLFKYFKDKGIFHTDDMSSIILTSYYRYRHNKPINLKEQIEYYKEYWKKHGK